MYSLNQLTAEGDDDARGGLQLQHYARFSVDVSSGKANCKELYLQGCAASSVAYIAGNGQSDPTPSRQSNVELYDGSPNLNRYVN
jgi:hypothetical protein